MKRQFTAGAMAKKEVRKLNVLLKEVEAGANSIINDYDKHVAKLKDHNIDLKIANMKLENDHKMHIKSIVSHWETKHALAVEDANFHKTMNNIAAEDEKRAAKTLLDQHKIIQQQGKEIFQLENDLYDMKRRRDGLLSILWALIISIIILLVW
jgi:hypothetical protein